MRQVVFTVYAHGDKPLAEVRQVLDAVAHRIAKDAWQGVLADALLVRVHNTLRRLGRRKVCIVARAVSGFADKHMEILWTVGTAKVLGAQGDWIVGSRAGHPVRSPARLSRRQIRRVSQTAGAYHDLGKNTKAFQAKLRSSKPLADALRHEVLSLAQLRGQAWAGHLAQWALTAPLVGATPAAAPVEAAARPLDWVEHLVLTHHRLPQANLEDGRLDLMADYHVNPTVETSPASFSAVDPGLAAIQGEGRHHPVIPGKLDFLASRLSLMLADHYVSSVRERMTSAADSARPPRPSALRSQVLRHLKAPSSAKANGDDVSAGVLGQSLAGHLQAVGAMARVIAPTLLSGRWMAGLAALEPDRFAPYAGIQGRFAWQARAVRWSRRYAHKLPNGLGGLVLVGSSTGSGKTRACLAMADALGTLGTRRMTVALGLRTLTLQTGREYREIFQLQEDEMGVLIGSQEILRLDAQARYAEDVLQRLGRDEGQEADEDADPKDLRMSDEGRLDPADFLPFIEAQCPKDGQRRYLDVPVLVTTLDHVIQAADHRRAGWILPALRLASSSALVIDEVDGYDLSDFPPLLRLVELAAMLGVPVIASSATLYPAFAKALALAWADGAQERARFLGIAFDKPSCLLVGDEPDTCRMVAVDDVSQEFRAFSRDMTRNLEARRVAQVIGAQAKSREAMFACMTKACLDLHEKNQVQVRQNHGQPVGLSVGLVRIAHVKNVVAFAKFLQSFEWPAEAPLTRVVLYHSQNTVLGRAFLERRLDRMLYRKRKGKPWPLAPMDDPDVAACVHAASQEGRGVCILVVATSVEEVGRDHDFDWAVIEPSSARSIVQTCGRVMRHRLQRPSHANVAVLARNFRELQRLEQGAKWQPCFINPGFERAGQMFPDHDIARAIVKQLPAERTSTAGFFVDARLCLDPSDEELGFLENQAIESYLQETFRGAWSARPVVSMLRNHYAQYRFRASEPETVMTLDFRRGIFISRTSSGIQENPNLRVTSVLGNLALWTMDWGDIQHEFEGLDVRGEAYRQIRISRAAEAPSQMTVDPLYGFVE